MNRFPNGSEAATRFSRGRGRNSSVSAPFGTTVSVPFPPQALSHPAVNQLEEDLGFRFELSRGDVSRHRHHVRGGVRRWISPVDQTFAQVAGDEALLCHAELLNRGFDFGHRAHGSISASVAAAGNVGGLRPLIYETGN